MRITGSLSNAAAACARASTQLLAASAARRRGSSALALRGYKAAPPADAPPFASKNADELRPRHREIRRKHALFIFPVCSTHFARDLATSWTLRRAL